MPDRNRSYDVIIIGQGLAGAVLSETLAQRGLRVMMFDQPQDGRASWMAAGLVNPVVLRRLVLSWRAPEMLAVAAAFYRDLELRYDTTFWHPMPLVKIHPNGKEAGEWRNRMKDPEIAPFIQEGPVDMPGLDRLEKGFGHGVVPRAARLDVRALLTAHRSRWIASGDLEEAVVGKEAVHLGSDGGEVLGRTAPMIIHCEGPFADLESLSPVRGEGLTVRIPGLGLKCIVHRSVFLLPLGEDRYRLGATYAWQDVWSGPTEAGRVQLMERLDSLVDGEVEVLEHWAGVRPASRDRRPIMGRLDRHEAVFNGLGSRGVLLAPWCAQHLAAHLLDGSDLDAEVDLARFAVRP
ncbi:MAG: FAD-dependent oxidoreductase [Flavobacteriales bacterium]|nr:FAD-dependent oxidoreductase [Flavobacteriales bacterium]MCB9193559.1 FAD-dependent oxidoreductase [Flavobacteriales bacterium]